MRVLEVFLRRSPYGFNPQIIIRKACGDRTIIAACLYNSTYDVSTGYRLTFFFKCKSSNYYKIVEAMKIVGSRGIVATWCHDKKCTFAVCGVWIICLIFFKCLVEHNRYLETLTQE